MPQKTFLVTGGAGFVGSHVCEYLAKRGDKVVCFDNLSTGKFENLTEARENMVFAQGDVNSRADLEKIFAEHRFDGIFHYAAIVGVKRTLQMPIEILEEVNGIRHILELALKNGKPKVMFSSSSEVYGEPVEIPETEDGHINAKLPYAVTKLYGEKMLEAYWEKHQLPTCSLRFFNVYGPRQDSSSYGFVGGIFVKNVLEGKAPVVFGDGAQTRDFVYVDDNVKASVLAFESEKTNGQVLNIGTGRPTTIFDLAQEVIFLCGKSGQIVPEFAEKRDDVRHRFPDIRKMMTLLNFRPEISLQEGLKKLIAWYQAQAK
jgi:UDP-glucose 4-epimerase